MPEEFKESIEIEVKAGQSIVLDLTAKKKDAIPAPVTLSENGAIRILLANEQSLFDTRPTKIYLKGNDKTLSQDNSEGKLLFEELAPGEYELYTVEPTSIQEPDHHTVKKVTVKKGTLLNVPLQIEDSKIAKIGVYPRPDSMGWSRMYMHLWMQAEKEGKTELNDKERWVLQACDAIGHRYRVLNRSKKEVDRAEAANLRIIPSVISYDDLKAMVSLKSSSFIGFNKDLRDFKHDDEWFYANNKYKQYFPSPKNLTKEVFDGWWKESVNTKIKDGFLEEVYEKKPAPKKGQVFDLQWIAAANEPQCIILFPSMLTPAVIWKQDDLVEIVILKINSEPNTRPLTKEEVSKFLKVSDSLSREKKHFTSSISSQSIKVSLSDSPRMGSDNSKFQGVMSKWFFKYENQVQIEETEIYTVRFPYNELLKLLNSPIGNYPERDVQDSLIIDFLKKRNGENLQENIGLFGFALRGGSQQNKPDFDFTRADHNKPIRAYHPIFYVKDRALNIGHLTDLHLNARQHLLSKSKARVIEWLTSNVSPEIGTRVNVSIHNVIELLEELGQSNADVILIGGDVIDFIKNIEVNTDLSITQIWNELSVFNQEKTRDNYVGNNIDYILFHQIIVDFLVKYHKPVFIVSGNHDAYLENYGISPRIFGKKANAGIPADHNLTIYEATLGYGPDYHDLPGNLKVSSNNVVDEHFDWFYSILTPFSNYRIELPMQVLVALGWGNTEEMWPGTSASDAYPLPIAVENFERNLEALTEPKEHKKMVLLTHFTFASYHESVPMTRANSSLGQIPNDYEDRSLRDVYCCGTFKNNRTFLYSTIRKYQLVLSGHSHRRGIYTFQHSENSLIKMSDFDNSNSPFKISEAEKAKLPLMIVSDSCGPVPRYNYNDEFKGWGSNRVSASLIEFSDTGEVQTVSKLEAGPRPRLCVSLDYMGSIAVGDNLVTKPLSTFRIDPTDGSNQKQKLTITLQEELAKIIEVEAVLLCYYQQTYDEFTIKQGEPEMEEADAQNNWTFSTAFIEKIEGLPLWRDSYQNNIYVSIKLMAKDSSSYFAKTYNMDDRWNFQVKVDKQDQGCVLTKESNEPSFFWRTTCISHYSTPYGIYFGQWLNKEGFPLKSARWGDTVQIRIITTGFPDQTALHVTIMDYDGPFNEADELTSFNASVTDNYLTHELVLSKNTDKTGSEEVTELYFKVEATVKGTKIKSNLTLDAEKWLEVR